MQATDDSRYLTWNTRVALFWLTKPTGSQETYLSVTPSGLAVAAWECDGVRLSPEEAENDLIAAVRLMYRRHILDAGTDIGCLAVIESNVPLCLAFLAFSVLAAHRMHADDANRSTAFYARLAQFLDCPRSRERPKGFSTEGFEKLWILARDWTATNTGTPLFVPKSAILRRYVAYPLAHVGLRQVDLDKLPEFFDWADYTPNSVVAFERLRDDLTRWVSERARLTRTGRAACMDGRLDAVLQQVAQELKAWDGIAQDASGRRIAHVELILDVPRGVAKLSYLARRPPGFPEVFEHGAHRFDSLEEGWYDPLPVPSDHGAELLHGFEWVSTQTSPSLVLRRAGALAIAFVRSEEYSGLSSRRRLLAGVDCALLYHQSVADAVHARLEQIVSSRPTPVSDAGLPDGWRLLLGVRIDQPSATTVQGLEALEVDAAVDIMTVGGLRIGRRAEWLVEHPPKVLVSGAHSQVTIDGRPVRVLADGFIERDHRSCGPGVHVLEAGRAHRRISLVEADIAQNLPALGGGGDANEYTLALARGRWVVLGERPGQLVRFELPTQKIVRAPFTPLWAILQAAPGCALFLAAEERPSGDVYGSESEVAAWAESITSASARAVPLASLDPAACAAAQRSWAKFVRRAAALRNSRDKQVLSARSKAP